MVERIPMGRIGEPDEVAALICWLASEECSFSTGATFDVSGGRAVSSTMARHVRVRNGVENGTLEDRHRARRRDGRALDRETLQLPEPFEPPRAHRSPEGLVRGCHL